MMIKLNRLVDKSLIKTLHNLDNMTKSIDTVVKKDISNTISKIDLLSKDVNLLSNDIRTIVNTDVKALIEDFRKTAKSSEDIDKVLNELESTLLKIDSTVDEFNQNGGNMIFNTREIKYGPGENNNAQ